MKRLAFSLLLLTSPAMAQQAMPSVDDMTAAVHRIAEQRDFYMGRDIQAGVDLAAKDREIVRLTVELGKMKAQADAVSRSD